MSRIAVALLALLLVVSTGMARSVTYLCLMDGRVHSTCCCKKAQQEPAYPRVEGQGCCEVRVPEATPGAVATRAALHGDRVALPPLLAALPPKLDFPRRTVRDVLPAVDARAPPGATGSPIFVWKCSYLI
jgi:hypothetical protein